MIRGIKVRKVHKDQPAQLVRKDLKVIPDLPDRQELTALTGRMVKMGPMERQVMLIKLC